MKYTRNLFAGVAMSTLILLAPACSREDGVSNSSAAASTEASSTAQEALTALALHESGAGALSFESSDVKGAKNEFNNVTVKGKTGEAIKIDKVTLIQPSMDGDTPDFSSVTFSNITLAEADENKSFTVGEVEITEPNADMMKFLQAAFNGEQVDEFKPEKLGDFDFGSIALKDLSAKGPDDILIHLDKIAMKDMNDGILGGLILKNLAIQSPAGPNKADIKLEEVNLTHLFMKQLFDESYLQSLSDSDPDFDAEIMSSDFIPSREDFAKQKGFIKGFSMNAAGITVSFPEMSYDSQEKKDVVTQTFDMKNIEVKAEGGGPAGAALAMPLGGLGLDALRLDMTSFSKIDFANDKAESRITTNVDKLATIDMSSNMTGLASMYSLEPGTRMNVIDFLSPIGFETINLSLKDDGGLERGFNFAGQMGVGSREQITQQAAGFIGLASLGAETDFQKSMISSLGTSVQKFLTDGGTFSVAIKAKQPLKVGDFVGEKQKAELQKLMTNTEDYVEVAFETK